MRHLFWGAIGSSRSAAPVVTSINLTINNNVLERNLSIGGQANAQAVTSQDTKSHPVLSKVQLPVRPKKPMTPFLAFIQERKEEILRDKPMNASRLVSVLSKEWATVNKSRYEQEFQQKLVEYHRAIEFYRSSLTDEHRAVIQHQKDLRDQSKAKREFRRTKPPVLPRSPANLYISERCHDPDVKEQMKNRKSALVLKDLREEYNNLSDSTKEKYVKLQQEDRLRFKHEFEQWHERIRSDPNVSKVVQDKAKALIKYSLI